MADVTAYGITAPTHCWADIGATLYHREDGSVEFGGWQSYASDRGIMIEAAKAAGLTGAAALAHVYTEIRRQREHGESVRAHHALAASISQVASALGAESAESLVRRLPEKLRPYVEKVFRSGH